MEVIFLELFFFLLIACLALGIIIPVCKKHKKATGKIINYDSTMRKFVYRVNSPEKDIISMLAIKNSADELSCDIDFDNLIMKFSEYGSDIKYYFYIEEYADFSILKLEQTSLIEMNSHIPLKLNPFMISKLKAEIVPFNMYVF